MSAQQLMTTSACDACRRAVVNGSNTRGIRDSAREFLATNVTHNKESIEVDVLIDRDEAENELENAIPGDIVTIEVRIPASKICSLPFSAFASYTLRGVCTMVHE